METLCQWNFIAAILPCLFLLLQGNIWIVILTGIVAGILAEVIAGIGKFRNPKLNVLSYVFFSENLLGEIVLFTSCIVIVGISGQVKSAGHFLIAFLLMLWDHTPPSPNEMYRQIKMFYDDLSSNTLLYIILVFITLLYTLKSIFPM